MLKTNNGVATNEQTKKAFKKIEEGLKVNDLVNHPSHYTHGNIEVIEAIEDWKLGYHLGNAIKYIARCNHKGNKEQDLKKAIWYLERELKNGLK